MQYNSISQHLSWRAAALSHLQSTTIACQHNLKVSVIPTVCANPWLEWSRITAGYHSDREAGDNPSDLPARVHQFGGAEKMTTAITVSVSIGA